MFLHADNLDIFLRSSDFNNFKVDDFIISIDKRNDLEIVLEGLKRYHDFFSQHINCHIDEEYIDYIILSENIATIDKYIRNMTLCLEKFKNTIFERKSYLDGTLAFLKNKITEKNSIQKQKYLVKCIVQGFIKLDRIANISSSSGLQNAFLIFLEIEAINISMIQIYLNKNYLYLCKENETEILKGIENKLATYFLRFINEKDFENCLNILNIYCIIDKRKEAQAILRQFYVTTFMNEHATGKNILKYGIVKVYDDILNFVSKFCTFLRHAMQSTENYPEYLIDYNFIVDAFWIEVLQQIIYAFPVHIFSVGNAEQFHANYSASVTFLQRFERCFKNLTSIKRMHEHNIYQTFVKKWNLEAYFKIKFIEIAGYFERTLLLQKKEIEKCKDSLYFLSPSNVLHESLNMCWDDSVFTPALSHEFWKLTLQLISRYNAWALSYIEESGKNSTLFYQVTVSVIVDVQKFLKEYEKLFDNVISSKIDKLLTKAAFSDSLTSMKETVSQVEKIIVESQIQQIYPHIASISDIPRLYLKTNRHIPVTPSSYVIEISNSLLHFLDGTDSTITKELKKSLLDRIAILLIENWENSVHDAVISMNKIQESIKILKRVKNKPTTEATSNGVSDEEKIKMQFMLDVNTMEEFLKSLGIENVDKIKKIKEFIHLCSSNYSIT